MVTVREEFFLRIVLKSRKPSDGNRLAIRGYLRHLVVIEGKNIAGHVPDLNFYENYEKRFDKIKESHK